MVGGKFLEISGVRGEIVQKAVKLAMQAHDEFPRLQYVLKKNHSSNEVFFVFPGSWSADDWYSKKAFGATKIDVSKFPSIKSIGNNEIALVNEAFDLKFQKILQESSIGMEVEKAISEWKQIYFTGHSLGGAMAILFAIWVFEKYISPNSRHISPYCITFGSPLVGNHIFSHALRRENWARYFLHFVARYDIIPRFMLTPFPATEHGLQPLLDFMNPKSPCFLQEPIGNSLSASSFAFTVMRDALSVASHSACLLKGCTNLLLETISNIVERSPYRPFGTFFFLSENGKLVVVDNPDAVLQLFYFCLQFQNEADFHNIVNAMYRDHFCYECELQETSHMQHDTVFGNLVDLPLSSDAQTDDAMALNALGLSTRARLCLCAAGEVEKQKQEIQKKVDEKKIMIEEALKKIQEYQIYCDIRKIGYYDSFKIQKDKTDFDANVVRQELAGIWDEIKEILRMYEVPDGFEARKEWIELGTVYRRLVEPLDIANYYRHLKNEDTGPYMVKARPKRYRITQKWREHAERMMPNSISETTFWAEVEELQAKSFSQVKDRILLLEKHVSAWVPNGLLGKEVFLAESTFTKWWKTLPWDHRSRSCISGYFDK